MERGRFTNQDKAWVHNRANRHCEFPAGCENKSDGIIHHITGVYEGHLKGVPDNVLSDPSMNAVELCPKHRDLHDIQEKEQVTLYENRRYTSRTKSSYKRSTKKRRR
jgi:hypothetical protein